jgi:type I restriction enzyme S subunit
LPLVTERSRSIAFCLAITTIFNANLLTENTKCVSEEEYRKYKKNLGSTTILISINGTIGNIAFFNSENVILGKSAAYINIKNFISKPYIFYILQTYATNCYFEDELTGSTIRNLSLKSIRNAPILVPPTLEPTFRRCDSDY